MENASTSEVEKTMPITEDEIEKLITYTQMFMNHVHWVQQSFNLLPDNQHYGTCINYIDMQEYRDEFCREIVNTIPEWVYSQKKAAAVLDTLISEGRSQQNAQTALTTLTFEKFRNSRKEKLLIQGQFGELLLFNFMQSFFKCVPLLRKMPITTSVEMERFGADAIHYKYSGDKNLFYLGEAKTYSSKYQFNTAIADAIGSIIKTCFCGRLINSWLCGTMCDSGDVTLLMVTRFAQSPTTASQ